MAKHLEMEVGKVAGEKEIWMNEVKEDKRGLEWVQSRLCEPSRTVAADEEDGEGGGHVEEGEEQGGGVRGEEGTMILI